MSVEPRQLPAPVVFIRQKIAPLRLTVSSGEPRRVNLLIPTIDFDYVFGGYIAKLNLARSLAETGFQVRIVIVDQCEYQPGVWKRQLQNFEGLGSVLDHCELAYVFDRSVPLRVNPNDCFIATTWWTAHIAHHAVQTLGKSGFLYLIQEYEPFTFPMGSYASLAGQTYRWPHWALFSTAFLRDYFQQRHLGVFAGGCQEGEKKSAVFQNAITAVGPVTARSLSGRSKPKLLFYARPEPHAARNMFELGLLALCEAIDQGVFDRHWEFTGIGSVAPSSRLGLTQGRVLAMERRQSQADYKQVLLSHDLGLSLMYTPHPSLVPIEMASAGMVVVTNTYCNKTADLLRCISPNLLGVEPSLEGLVAGLRAAVARASQFEERAAGAQVNWCSDWSQAFGPATLQRVAGFLEQISA
jgi:hypothetical protein